jgi:AcrR family transcriptional regulator
VARIQPEDKRKADILEAAKACFVDKGFAATRMDDVAAGAGLSKGGLYFHFPSKNELMVEVIRRENDALGEFLELAQEWTDPLPVQMERLVEYYFAYLATHLDSARISQCGLDEATRNPDVALVMRDGESLFCGFLDALFRRAIARGELAAGPDTAVLARACMVIIEGVKTNYLHFPGWPWREVMAHLKRMVLRGLLDLDGGSP